jgi:hypothetical protein
VKLLSAENDQRDDFDVRARAAPVDAQVDLITVKGALKSRS